MLIIILSMKGGKFLLKKKQWFCSLVALFLVLMMTGCTLQSQEQEEEQNILVQTSWVSDTDYSQIIFSDGQEFEWYQLPEDKTDNYFTGTYSFYIGQEAMDYITQTFSEYEVTEEDMEGIFLQNEEYELDNFVALNLKNDYFVLDGEEQVTDPEKPYFETYFFGFLREDGAILDIANMDSGMYAWFVKE